MNRLSNSKKIKRGASALALCLTVGAMYVVTPLSANAANKSKGADLTGETKTEQAVESSYPSLTRAGTASKKDKVETTYTSMDADGNVKETVVTEQLTNDGKVDKLNDYSTLKDIENTSGHEKFTQNGNNVSWDAEGKPIKYKGTPTAGLPVNVKITYFLNGEKMSAKKIAGKSGNITIRFDYTVNQSEYVKGHLIKHPYTVASGLVLNNEKFSDVSVSNGKAIDDSGNGSCLPGDERESRYQPFAI